MQPDWTIHRTQLEKLVRKATAQLLQIVRQNPTMTPEDMAFYYAALVEQYGAAATESALLALENSRRTLGLWTELEPPAPANLPPMEQIEGTLAWAVKKAEENPMRVAALLAGPLGRLIQQPARDTVWNATRSAGTRYARVPGPKACWFCLMLASRGGVYTSKQAALSVTKRSATRPQTAFRNAAANSGHTYQSGRPEGAKYHDNCTCIAIESHDPADLPDVVQQLQKEWYEVTWDERGPKRDQAAIWREHIKNTRPHGETLRP